MGENVAQRLTAGITDLDTSLTNVHGDDFTHFEKMKEAKMAWKAGQYSGEKTTRSVVLTEIAENFTDTARQNRMKAANTLQLWYDSTFSRAPVTLTWSVRKDPVLAIAFNLPSYELRPMYSNGEDV